MGTISSINNMAGSYLESLLSNSATSSQSSSTSSVAAQSETGQLSPFAQLMSTLQQLQQSNPAEYKQVTQQISTNLAGAAQTATTDGNSTQAAQLNQLSTDFARASQSCQLPNMQDLAQAIGGHHHHHHAHPAAGDTDSDSNASNQFLAAFQSNTSQNDATNPMAIIMNTLATAGLSAASNG